jgi:hypothetical protein
MIANPINHTDPYMSLRDYNLMQQQQLRDLGVGPQENPAAIMARQNKAAPVRGNFQSIPNSPTPQQINNLAAEATIGGKKGEKAKNILEQRAAAGDAQAKAVVDTLDRDQRNFPASGSAIPGKPGAVADGNGGWSYPSGGPKTDSAAVTNRQKAAAPKRGEFQSVPDRAPTPPIIMRSGPSTSDQFAQIRQNQANAAQRAIQNQNPAANQRQPQQSGSRPRSGGGGGGGGRGKGGGAPRQTAKERNMAADERANKAARRADSRGFSDSAYRYANQDSAAWGENEAARRARLEKAGLNPDYHGWKDNPQYERDVNAANKRHWDNFNNRQKEKEKQDQRKSAAENFKKAMQEGSFTDADGNIKPSKNPDGSASEDLWLWTQSQRPPGSGRKMVQAYGNKHSSVLVAARPQP